MADVIGQQVTTLKLIRARAGASKIAELPPGTVGTVLRQQSQLGRPMLQVKFPALESSVMLYPEEVELS